MFEPPTRVNEWAARVNGTFPVVEKVARKLPVGFRGPLADEGFVGFHGAGAALGGPPDDPKISFAMGWPRGMAGQVNPK